MIVLIDAFDKIHSFVIKMFNNLGTEETYLNVIQATCEKATAAIVFSSDRLKASPLGTGVRLGCHPIPTTSTPHSSGALARTLRQEKERNASQSRRKK